MQTNILFGSNFRRLDRVPENESPEETERALNDQFVADKSAEIRLPPGNFMQEETKELQLPLISFKQHSAPVDTDENISFMTPRRRKRMIKQPYDESGSSEGNDSEESDSDLNLEGLEETRRDFYGIEFLYSKEQEKEKEGRKMNTKKFKNEIDALQYPKEIIEAHVNSQLLKYVINEKVDELREELEHMKLVKDAYTENNFDGNNNIKETVMNTSINPPTPHNAKKVTDEEKRKAETKFKHNLSI
jgi:hypothetical protein